MAVTLLTVSAYARHRGCDEKAVRKAIAENRISAQDGKNGRKLIDPAVADIQWARNTRARVGAAPAQEPDLLSGAAAAADPKGQAGAASGYTAARVRTELANAARAELELARMRAEVRDVVDITRGGFDISREMRDAMDSSVNTLATELAALTSADDCAKVLRQHNRTIQQLLAQRLREKLAVKVDAA